MTDRMAIETGEEDANKTSRPRRPRRSWPWILLAFLTGTLLPVMLCGGLVLVGLASMGGAGSGSSFGVGPGVAIIRVSGVLVPGESSSVNGASGSATVVRIIKEAQADPDVKAIVLRVDSPGGGVVASDEIHHALAQVNKPIVVTMGSLAASGGYYISAPADYIYATPHTLTGSIGVISTFVSADDLLEEYGVDVVVLTTGEYKDTGSLYRDMTESDIAYWQGILDETYDGFVNIVVEGRGISEQDVLALADGRVFTGTEAVELGLVDEIGYFEDAIARAADLGGIEGDPRLIEYETFPTFLEYLGAASSGQSATLAQVLDILQTMSQPSMEYRYVGP